jgi:hypothetical protein
MANGTCRMRSRGGPRPTPVLGQEQRQAALGRAQILLRVQGAKDVIGGDAAVEARDQRFEEGHAADAVIEGGLLDHAGKDTSDEPGAGSTWIDGVRRIGAKRAWESRFGVMSSSRPAAYRGGEC